MELSLTVATPHISLSMPYLLEGTYKPEWSRSKAKNAAKLKSLLKRAEVVATYTATGGKVPVLLVEDGGADFYFVHANIGDDPDMIQYGARVRHYDLTGKLHSKACGQVSVWRNGAYDLTTNLPEWLFTNRLYPKYSKIISDNTQSTRGRGFWVRRIGEALQKGKTVSAIEVDEVGFVIKVLAVTSVKSIADMGQYYTTGENYSGHYYRFLIE
jgi:hypothetical protein